MDREEFFMQKCLELAQEGRGTVSPNPMVGSIIIYKNKIIGKGYHQKYGEAHAEVNAINSVQDKTLLSKSTLFVNLEPCAHFGKTPPCSDLIIKYKIPKVVIGCIDYSSKVSGKGIRKMEKNGIHIQTGVLQEESRNLNKRFLTFHNKKRPYIILKWAESKDRFIAPKNQTKPFWITCSESKKLAHKWRAQEDAILVGKVTAIKDNPRLTVRETNGKNPIRIIIDKDLTLSNNLNILNNEAKTIIINSLKTEQSKSNYYIKIDQNNIIKDILKKLYRENIQSIIIEGGSKTLKSFIRENMWDEAKIFTTNKNLYDGLKSPNISGRIIETKKIGNDKLKIMLND